MFETYWTLRSDCVRTVLVLIWLCVKPVDLVLIICQPVGLDLIEFETCWSDHVWNLLIWIGLYETCWFCFNRVWNLLVVNWSRMKPYRADLIGYETYGLDLIWCKTCCLWWDDVSNPAVLIWSCVKPASLNPATCVTFVGLNLCATSVVRADAAPPRHAAGPSAVLLAALSTHTGISGGCGTCSPVSLSVCLCCWQLRYLWMGRGFACCSLCSWVDLFIGLCVCEGRSERERVVYHYLCPSVFFTPTLAFRHPGLGRVS